MQAKHAEKRESLRQLYRRKRQAISASEHAKYASQIVDVFIKHNVLNKSSNSNTKPSTVSKKVALYRSFDGELDTQAFIDHLWSQGIEVYLPVLHPFSESHLLFLRYTLDSCMTSNRFGIAEPSLDVQSVCPLMQLDIIFTPLVAFDAQGNRLGMGGGFYDRTLASVLTNYPHSKATKKSKNNVMRSRQKPRVIGLALDEQESPALPTETWDIPLPQILTPTRLYSFR